MSETGYDWERIGLEYRAGILSLREIAASHSLSEGAIRKRAKRDDWTRDISAKIKARAEDLVRKQAVRSEVRNDSIASERVLIEANAEQIARIRGEHRADIGRTRTLALKFLAELEAPEDELALPARVSTLKALSETLKNLVAMEREAYGIGTTPEDAPSGDFDPVEAARKLAFILARADHQLTVH